MKIHSPRSVAYKVEKLAHSYELTAIRRKILRWDDDTSVIRCDRRVFKLYCAVGFFDWMSGITRKGKLDFLLDGWPLRKPLGLLSFIMVREKRWAHTEADEMGDLI